MQPTCDKYAEKVCIWAEELVVAPCRWRHLAWCVSTQLSQGGLRHAVDAALRSEYQGRKGGSQMTLNVTFNSKGESVLNISDLIELDGVP